MSFVILTFNGETFSVMTEILPKFGVEVTFVELSEYRRYKKSCTQRNKTYLLRSVF